MLCVFVLGNGSPTYEFQFERGLRQGDSLLLFLFSTAVEGLNVMINALVSADFFRDTTWVKIIMFAFHTCNLLMIHC